MAVPRCHSLSISQSICIGIPGVKGNLFPMKTAKHWKRLPRDAVQSPPFVVFKAQLDEALSNLAWPHSWSHFEHEIGLETSWGSFNLSYPMIQISLLLAESHLSPTLPTRNSLLPHAPANPSVTSNLMPAWQGGAIITPWRAVPPAGSDAASQLPDTTKCRCVWRWFPNCQYAESRGRKAFLKSRQAKWWQLQPDKNHVVGGLEAAGFLVQACRYEEVFNA